VRCTIATNVLPSSTSNIVVDFHLYFPIQSSLNTLSSSAGAFEGESADKMEEGARKLEKCARSSSVTEFRFDDTVAEAPLCCSKLGGVFHAGALTRCLRRATASAKNIAGPGPGRK
jgi:hypothetical protein